MLHGLLRGRPLLYPCQQYLCEPEKLGACLFDPSHFGLRLIVSFYRAMQSFAEGSSCWSYDDTVQSFLEARKVRFEHIDDAMLRDASEVAAYHKPCIDRTLCYQGRQNDQVIQLHATHHYRGDSASCMIFVGQEEAFRHHSCPTYDLHKHDGAGKHITEASLVPESDHVFGCGVCKCTANATITLVQDGIAKVTELQDATPRQVLHHEVLHLHIFMDDADFVGDYRPPSLVNRFLGTESDVDTDLEQPPEAGMRCASERNPCRAYGRIMLTV